MSLITRKGILHSLPDCWHYANSCRKYSVLTPSNPLQPVSCDICSFVVMASDSHWSRSTPSRAVSRVTLSNRNNFGAIMGKPHSYTAEAFNDLTYTQLSSSSFSIAPNRSHRHVTSHRTQQIKSLSTGIHTHTHTQTHTLKQKHTHARITQFDGQYKWHEQN